MGEVGSGLKKFLGRNSSRSGSGVGKVGEIWGTGLDLRLPICDLRLLMWPSGSRWFGRRAMRLPTCPGGASSGTTKRRNVGADQWVFVGKVSENNLECGDFLL